MILPPRPDNELERLTALRSYNILDTEADAEYDAITALVASICDVPTALVSLVDADRQWFKSACGFTANETARDVSFCAHAILDPPRTMIVTDATADPRFWDNPLVVGEPHVRFYAGVPLLSPSGFALGTLCLLDTRARDLNAHHHEILRLAARAVLVLLEQHKTIAHLRAMAQAQRRVEVELRNEIASRRRAEQQLSFASTHDDLTGLPNRAEFVARLGVALDRLRVGDGAGFAVCFIDLDRFKTINDTLGHLAGDTLLIDVARRLSEIVRVGDVVARLGGDEFTMLVDGVMNETMAFAVAERAARALEAKLRLADVDVKVTASVGVVLIDDSYAGVEEVLRDADIAMYAAKERGRDRSVVFTTELRDQFAHASEMQLALRTALDREEFQLAYQPIVALHDECDEPAGFEALLRWQQADGTLVSAAEFIEAAETTGLIIELGTRVLRHACAQARRWQVAFGRPIVTAVNVSARQLGEPDFAQKVKAIVRASGLEPQRLALEVTESILIADVESSIAIIDDLRRFGIKIYLDDFGTGYSSLNYLRKFPLDRIKIDRSFVSGAGEDLADPVIVHSIVALAHKLGLRVVAEGVETECQRAALVALGCDYAQGFLFSKAVPAQQAAEFFGNERIAGVRVSAA